jgi:hypothetical protein
MKITTNTTRTLAYSHSRDAPQQLVSIGALGTWKLSGNTARDESDKAIPLSGKHPRLDGFDVAAF